ncbi:MAG: fasciclin domain-containing protein [Hyphomicrobiaceae bacterium]
MNFFKTALAAIALALPLAVTPAAAGSAKKDIVDTAVSAGQFNTLVAAVKAAGLVETLKGKGPFTVFAPTDAAFKKLPKGTVEDLLKPENKAKLAAILTYHVVPGKVMSADIAGKKLQAASVQGQKISIDATKSVKVDGANVVKADIGTSNGVIHVIDAVILPKS